MSSALTYGQGDIQRVRKRLKKAGRLLKGAPVRALNKTATGARTDTVTEVGRVLTLKKKRIRKAVAIQKANTRSPQAVVTISSEPVSLHHFKTTPAKKPKRQGVPMKRWKPKGGVKVQVRKDRAATVIPRTFLASPRGDDRSVLFQRKGKGRYPLKYLWGPGPGSYLKRGRVRRKTVRSVNQRLEKNLAHEVKRGLTEAGLS